MTPRVYIVIGVHSRDQYQQISYLDKMMETLEAYTQNYIPIFVSDYCDEEGHKAIERHAAKYPSSSIIKTHKQRWFSRSYNLGLRLVRGEWAVLLNVDIELGENWLEELFLCKDEVEQQSGQKVGLVGSELSAEEQRRCQIVRSPSTPGDPGYVTGHCLLLNMNAAWEVSCAQGTPGWILDETNQRSIHIFSDNHLSYGLQKLGWLTVRSFKSACGHAGGKSWGHDLSKVFSLRLEDVND